MWSKQQGAAEPAVSPAQGTASSVVPFSSPSNSRAPLRTPAHLGSGLQIRGAITGDEALQIDCKVDGPISIQGHELTVGPTAQLQSEIHAGDLIVYGKIVGNVYSRGRVDIKKDGSIIGDVSSARISIEDGAHFKGRIEIDPTKTLAAAG